MDNIYFYKFIELALNKIERHVKINRLLKDIYPTILVPYFIIISAMKCRNHYRPIFEHFPIEAIELPIIMKETFFNVFSAQETK